MLYPPELFKFRGVQKNIMPINDSFKSNEPFFKGGGEMGKMVREKDWSLSPIGIPATWPQSLRTMVSVMLENPFGMYIAWGKEYTQIYNDGYRPILGSEKHPKALGASTWETYAEIYDIVKPIFDDVMKGKAVSINNFELQLNRNGYLENCFFDVSYSPIRQEDGTVGGILCTITETTVKKKAIEDLTESESRFRHMAENTEILIAISDEQGESTFFNKAWLDFTGKSFNDLVKRGWFNLVHPDDQEMFLSIFKESFAQKKSFQAEFRILSKQGNYRWLLAQGPPRFRADGSFAGYISSCTDITDLKIAEQELKENKDQLEFAIDATELATWDFYPLTDKLSVNYRLKEWFNLSKEEDLSLSDALLTIAEKDQKRVQDAIKEAIKPNSGGVYDIKYTLENLKKKKSIIVHAKGKVSYNDKGISYRLTGTLEDITEETLARRKIEESEEVIKSIVASSPAGICVINSTNLVIEMVNDRFLEITDRSREEMLDKQYWQCFSQARPQYEAKLWEVIESGKIYTATDVEYEIIKKQKIDKGYSTFVFAPIKNEQDKIIKVAIWALDTSSQINALKKIEEREQEIRALVESAPFPIGVFTGKEMRIDLANQSIIEAWGKGNDVIGKLYSEILPELENQQIFKQLDDVFTSGKAFHIKDQKVDLLRDGQLKNYYFNYSLTPLFDAGGTIYGVMNTAADVTELHEAKQKVEAALEETKLFKFMIDNAADPFILMDIEGNFVYTNNIALEKWGYSRQEIKEFKIPDIDPNFNDESFKKLFEKNQEGNIPNFETSHRHKNGSVFPVEVSLGKVKFGEEKYMFAIVRDLTERKKAEKDLLKAFHKIEDSEKRFRDSVEQAPLGIAIFRGKDYIVEIANKVYLNLIGNKAETLIDLPFFETHPELEETIKPLFKEVIDSGRPFLGNEMPVTLLRKGHTEQAFFNLVYHPLKEENGEITGIMVVANEVTALVRAKHLLEESEMHLQKLVTQSPVGMTILKGENFIVDTANQVVLTNIWKKTEQEVKSKPIVDIFPELDGQPYPALLKKVFETGITYSGKEAPLFLKRQQGIENFFIDFEFAPLSDGAGNNSGIMVTVNNVTDKVEARKSVEEAEERLRLATDATGISTWDLDLENRKIIHSRRLSVIFGYPESAILTHQEMLRHVHPEDAFILERAVTKALRSGTYSYEARINKPDQTVAWIRTQGKVFYDELHKPVKMLGTLRDITDEKNYQQSLEESEEKFRLLSNSLAQQVWLSDPIGNLFYFNDTVLSFSGLTMDQLKNKGWLSMLHPDEIDESIRLWNESIATGTEFLFEHRFKRFDGEYRWQLSRALPQKDATGNIQMWVGSSTDIQEIKEQEQQKDLFISIASHELKTPLTSIKGYVQILQSMQKGVDTNFLEKSLRIIDKQVNKLTQLIAELLDVSKIKSVGLDFEKEEFEMTELIDEVVTEIRHINPQYEIPVEANEKIQVFADRNRIGQVLINFLNNAVKYSPRSMMVKVSCYASENGVRVSVEDTGIGIDKREQENIFQRFYRVEGTNETTFPGFGIGLFISSEIIRRHNGKIYLQSEYGKGSVFSFEIPLN